MGWKEYINSVIVNKRNLDMYKYASKGNQYIYSCPNFEPGVLAVLLKEEQRLETLECIRSRRSIRHFEAREIPENIFSELLEAVRWAPSWSNTQCWELVVVRDSPSRQVLLECVHEKNPAFEGLKEAPILMVFCGRKEVSGYKKGRPSTNRGDWYMFDVALACQNFCLAAHSLGLGTVHVGSFDHEAADRALGLPADVSSVEIIPLGYPSRASKAPARKELAEFVHYEKY